jgi:hypothetical protein
MDANKKKKVVIWVSITMLLGVGGYFAYTKLIKPKLDEKKAKKAAELAAANAAANTSTPATSSNSAPATNTTPDYWAALKTARSIGAPTFVFEGKTYDTKTGRVFVAPTTGEAAIGKMASPKGSYVNVRNSPSAASGAWNNTFIGQINSPNVVGKITNLTIGEDGKRWYNVNLLTPLSPSTAGLGMAMPNQTKGWVREDSVTIK